MNIGLPHRCFIHYFWAFVVLFFCAACTAKTPSRTLDENQLYQNSQKEIQLKQRTVFEVQFDFSPTLAERYEYKNPKSSLFKFVGESSKNKYKEDDKTLTPLGCCVQLGTWRFVAKETGQETLTFIYTKQDFPPESLEFKIRVVP